MDNYNAYLIYMHSLLPLVELREQGIGSYRLLACGAQIMLISLIALALQMTHARGSITRSRIGP